MTIYKGRRLADGTALVYVHSGILRELPLNPSLRLRNHSPSGFEWGYGGSGPSQLALAILLDCVGKEKALRYYQTFKWKFLSPAPHEGFDITQAEIEAFIAEHEEVAYGT